MIWLVWRVVCDSHRLVSLHILVYCGQFEYIDVTFRRLLITMTILTTVSGYSLCAEECCKLVIWGRRVFLECLHGTRILLYVRVSGVLRRMGK